MTTYRKLPKWDIGTTTKLIYLYGQNQHLWNTNSIFYKSNSCRIETYKKIIQTLGLEMSVNDMRTKIKNLRSIYHVELKKIKNSKLKGEDYKPKLPWFDKMYLFLGDLTEMPEVETYDKESSALGSNSNSSNILEPLDIAETEPIIAKTKVEPVSDSEIENTDIVIEEYRTASQPIYHSPEMEKFTISDDLSNISTSVENNTDFILANEHENISGASIYHADQNNSNSRKQNNKRKFDNNNDENLSKLAIVLDKLNNSLSSPKPSIVQFEDELDHFGKYIVAKIRKLPERVGVETQVKILNLLAQTQLDTIKDD